MENLKKHCIVNIKSDDFETAQHIAKILLSERLAACCTIHPNIQSCYIWKNNLQVSNEYLIEIKTRLDKFEILKQRVLELHKDEVPEVTAVQLVAASQSYLDWIDEILDEVVEK